MKELIKTITKLFGYQIIPWYGTGKEIELIKELVGLYRENGLKQLPNLDDTTLFLLSRLGGCSVGEACYIIDCLHKSINLEGDVCEFGVAKGRNSVIMAHHIKDTDKNIWLFDSFKGLSAPTEKDKLKDDILHLGSIEKYKGKMSCSINYVKHELKKINFPSSRAKIVAGFIEETICGCLLPNKVCFAFVDFDFYEPVVIALRFLDKVLQKGGFIIVDDYDFFSTGAKTAVDEFISANKEKYNFFQPSLESAGPFCIIDKL